MENELATFWRPALSHAFSNIGTDLTQGTPRKGTKTPREDLVAEAKGLINDTHMSYGEASQVMGLPRSTVWDLVNKG